MLSTIYRSIIVTVLLALILCGFYPITITGVAKLFFKHKSEGSLILKDHQIIGSELIGQNFSDPKYFHGRPSAAGEKGYDATNSSGSNLGPTSQKLVERIDSNMNKVIEENPGVQTNQIPVDLVTASGSGLDPHISPEAAFLQAERVSQARGISLEKVKALIQNHIEGPQWGIFGEKRVNVLILNINLDTLKI